MTAGAPHGGRSTWLDQIEQLEHDVERVSGLLRELDRDRDQVLGGRSLALLSRVSTGLDELRQAQRVGATPASLWDKLAEVSARARTVFGRQLELLGGSAIAGGIHTGQRGFDGGTAARAQDWIDRVRRGAGLNRELSVLAGVGPVLEPEAGVVRLPFLDWDLWTLPTLCRAVGLVVAEADDRAGELGEIAKLLEPQIAQLRPRDPGAQAREDVEWPLRYVEHLFADMFATGVIGPAYAAAIFVLELDYGAPEQLAVPDPGRRERGQVAPGRLPSAVQRAAAILATLRRMDTAVARRRGQPGPYTELVERLQALWEAAVPAPPGLLDAASERFASWHDELYERVLFADFPSQLADTEMRWRRCETWYQSALQGATLPRLEPRDLSELLGMIWRYRLEDPTRADVLLRVGELALEGQPAVVPRPSPVARPIQVAVQARLDRLERRWHRLVQILEDERLPPLEYAAIAGRFYRLLSRQTVRLEQERAELRRRQPKVDVWRRLAELEGEATPVRREFLEFLGSMLLAQRGGLDRELPARTGWDAGPSITALGGRMLKDLAVRAGIDWNGRCVLGQDAFVDTSTDLIRVRFPDWSAWSLPVLAHELGHVAATVTPDFVQFQVRTVGAAGPGRTPVEAARLAHLTQRHLDELFADVFATYVSGPAFACAAIRLSFNPAERDRWRDDHPTHGQRVRAILDTLDRMNRHARQRPQDPGPYADVLDRLRRAWTEQVQAVGSATGQADQESGQDEVAGWAEQLFLFVDASYRLGVGYTQDRWELAQQIAGWLLPPIPSFKELQRRALERDTRLAFVDVLNALWWARSVGAQPVSGLTRLGLQLGREYLEGDA